MVRHEVATRDANEKGQTLVLWDRNEAVHLCKALIVNYSSQDVLGVFLTRIQVQRTVLSRVAGE